MRFLLTNDDGIDAPGILALEEALGEFGTCVIVAPDRHLSGCSHQTTTDRSLTAIELRPGHFAVDGTPADCARLGLLHFAPDADWLLSGVNDGGNLGVDIFMSGTVAAAREATLLGRRAMALSHYRRSDQPIRWPQRHDLLVAVLRQLFEEQELPTRCFWNINFPAESELDRSPKTVFCETDRLALAVEFECADGGFRYRSNYHARPRSPGKDVDVCFGGDIAITRLEI